MDVFEYRQVLHKGAAVETIRRPLAPAERNNGITPRRSRTRAVSSRYKSPTPTPTPTPVTCSTSRRYPSPNLTRTINSTSSTSSSSSSLSSSSSHLASRRAVSAERRMPSTPPSPARPSTPVSDTAAEPQQVSSKKMTGSRLPEVLWPSTMRSLSVSFQSDSISIPVSKKEKPVSHPHSDRTLKPSSNVAQKPAETAAGTASLRKSTPERKRSPLKGRNSSQQSENSRPVDGLHSRKIEQHRWPSGTGGGKLSPSMLTKSMDLSNNVGKLPSSPLGKSMRRLASEGVPRPLQKAASESSKQAAFDGDDSLLRLSAVVKADPLSLSVRVPLVAPPVRSGSMPGSRLPSPSRVVSCKGSPSPSRTRPSTPTQSRGTSPSRMIRQSSPTRQSINTTTSVLSFIADIKKGKKTNQLEDAHHLRLLYNRYLQWRFANARVDAAMYIQKITAEQTLYNVWQANLELWDSVIMKRIELQRLKLELKLNLVLREQIGYLEGWALLDNDHIASLGGAIQDLEFSTLRLPVTGGAKADIDSLKAAISSAVDVMQAMASSVCAVLSKVEGMNGLVSELAELAGQERSMLNECDALLASTAAMQMRECSLRTQLVQSQQDLLLRKTRQPLLWSP